MIPRSLRRLRGPRSIPFIGEATGRLNGVDGSILKIHVRRQRRARRTVGHRRNHDLGTRDDPGTDEPVLSRSRAKSSMGTYKPTTISHTEVTGTGSLPAIRSTDYHEKQEQAQELERYNFAEPAEGALSG